MNTKTWSDLFLSHWQGSDAPAIITEEKTVSGDELMWMAAGAVQFFDSLGVGKDSVLPMLMDETINAIAVTVGGALSGQPLAPLGTKLPASDLVEMIEALGASYLLATPEYEDLATEVAELANIELKVISSLESIEPDFSAVKADDPVVIVHTSGTTGRGKPIIATQAAVAARTDAYWRVLGIGPGDVFCSASPFYHTAGVGMTLAALAMGVAIIPMAWFSVDGWRAAGRLGMTYGVLVPTMIDLLLEKGALADATPRILQYGASPIHPDTLSEALKTLPDARFIQIFGQTEVSPITYLSHEDHLRALAGEPELLSAAGKAVPGLELRIENPDSEGIGEITVRAKHALVFDDDGWRRCGDIGSIDEEGFLTLHGRTNDRIIRGGENIYPLEIEAVLTTHPAVKEVAIIGVPNKRWGEILKAFVVPAEKNNLPDVEELQKYVGDRLARFKIPEDIVFIDELPRNPNGKLLRRQLQ